MERGSSRAPHSVDARASISFAGTSSGDRYTMRSRTGETIAVFPPSRSCKTNSRCLSIHVKMRLPVEAHRPLVPFVSDIGM